MSSFFDSQLCVSRRRCRECRRGRDFRRGVILSFEEPNDIDFVCPYGLSSDDFPQDIEPTLGDMIKSLGETVSREGRAIAGGEDKIERGEYKQRLAICQDCQFWVNGSRCAKCGCFMRLKARLRVGKCPIGKW